ADLVVQRVTVSQDEKAGTRRSVAYQFRRIAACVRADVRWQAFRKNTLSPVHPGHLEREAGQYGNESAAYVSCAEQVQRCDRRAEALQQQRPVPTPSQPRISSLFVLHRGYLVIDPRIQRCVAEDIARAW